MTTSIYFLLMSLTLFVLPQLAVRFVLGYPVWDKRIRFLVYSAVLPMLWHLLVPRELNDIRQVNFLQHMTGGVSVGFITLYFISIFREKLSFKENSDTSLNLWGGIVFQAVFVYMCVSAFGVGNELLEFLLDWFDIGIFSADRYDVWFDLTANTTGAFVVFLLYRLFSIIKLYRYQ